MLFLCLPSTVQAEVVVDLGTPGNAPDWLITAAGAVDAPSFQSNVNRPGTITLLDNSLITGNIVAGGSVGAYNGFWYAENHFDIPVGAQNVQFQFADLWGNDRVVLSLNGVNIGHATFGRGVGDGLMRFEENGEDLPFVFSEVTSGTVTSGFNIGGRNTLRLTVNNTGINLAAPTVPSAFAGDGTVVHLPTATLSFTAIPEPSAAALLFAAAGCVVLRRKRS